MQFFLGVSLIIFGIIVGGAGIATAGVGIGIPVIPIGIYLTYAGYRKLNHKISHTNNEQSAKLEPFEKTKIGKIGLGVIIFLLGLGTSVFMIGIPIMIIGIGFIIFAFKK